MALSSLLMIILLALVLVFLVLDIMIRKGKISIFSENRDIFMDQEHLKAIREISFNLMDHENNVNTLKQTIHFITRAMNAEFGAILLYDEEKNGLVIKSSEGMPLDVEKSVFLGPDDRICYSVYHSGKPLLITDLRKIGFGKSDDNYLYRGLSLLCAPIRLGRHKLGVCLVANQLDWKPFSEQAMDNLRSIVGQIALLVEIEMNNRKLIQKMKQLDVLYKVSEHLINTFDLKGTLQKITELAQEITESHACSLRLLDKENMELEIMATSGVSGGYSNKGKIKVGYGVGGYVALKGEPVMIPDLEKDDRIEYTSIMRQEGLRSLISVPIRTEEHEVTGIISVYRKEPYLFPKETVELLSTFANNVSIAVKSAQLFDRIKRSYYETIQSLALALEARDQYTKGHSERVTDMAVQIAKEMDLGTEEIRNLRLAGMLHDIGKIAIPDNILLKPAGLTMTEFADIKTHPQKGEELLKPITFLEEIIPHIKQHHERYDGKGYPNGFAREEISLLARILAVSDAYDAMTSSRPYRTPLTEDVAVKEIVQNKGTQFDPEVVDAFLRVIVKFKERPGAPA